MLPPTASVPASGDTTGLYRRKAHTTTTDGLLVHPMNWLDERLFGWSRSARRGTSVWGGTAGSSRATSRVATPDISDDEDHGDYDNVIGYLPSIVGEAINGFGLSRSRTPKSLRSSFADLPSVRRAEQDKARSGLTPIDTKSRTPGISQPPSPTLSMRPGRPRQRKMSLTDSVPVERIGRLDHDETFVEATDELNRENEERRRRKAQ
jgi:glycerol-3-phosphate O-acyltransferase/dihydroxyacetone phosphate acyltransferase